MDVVFLRRDATRVGRTPLGEPEQRGGRLLSIAVDGRSAVGGGGGGGGGGGSDGIGPLLRGARGAFIRRSKPRAEVGAGGQLADALRVPPAVRRAANRGVGAKVHAGRVRRPLAQDGRWMESRVQPGALPLPNGPSGGVVDAPAEEAERVQLGVPLGVSGGRVKETSVGRALAPLLPHAGIAVVLLVPHANRRRAEGGERERQPALARARADLAPEIVAPHAGEVGERTAVDGSEEQSGIHRRGRLAQQIDRRCRRRAQRRVGRRVEGGATRVARVDAGRKGGVGAGGLRLPWRQGRRQGGRRRHRRGWRCERRHSPRTAGVSSEATLERKRRIPAKAAAGDAEARAASLRAPHRCDGDDVRGLAEDKRRAACVELLAIERDLQRDVERKHARAVRGLRDGAAHRLERGDVGGGKTRRLPSSRGGVAWLGAARVGFPGVEVAARDERVHDRAAG